jgi:hypothetical protein
LYQAARCDKNVLRWLADKESKPSANDSYVWDFGESGMIRA